MPYGINTAAIWSYHIAAILTPCDRHMV